jgi:putative FmdB family regulatory protein
MPVYLYECKKCNQVKEVRQGMLVSDDTTCEHCHIPMEILPALTASIRVGKYGKGGG